MITAGKMRIDHNFQQIVVGTDIAFNFERFVSSHNPFFAEERLGRFTWPRIRNSEMCSYHGYILT